MIDQNSIIEESSQILEYAEIIDSKICRNSFIDKYTRVEHSVLEENVKLERNNQIVYSNLGRYSYTGANTVIKNVTVGKFNSISWNVSMGGNTHDLNHITTHSFLVYPKWNMGGAGNWESASEKCITGHDVWIGSGATVLRGVSIGNGAVIGASSVITKNVPPYSIVIGSPGRVIRMRCKDEWIERLEKLEWWDFPEDIIRDNILLFKADLSEEILLKLEEIRERL